MATLKMRDAFGKLVHRNVTGSGTQSDPFVIVDREDGAGDSAFPIRDAHGRLVWLKADGLGTSGDPMAMSKQDTGGLASAMGVVVHDDDDTGTRPTGFGAITWIGSVESQNMAVNDIWYDTSA